jgi:rRNA maturation endonuclease Nob1
MENCINCGSEITTIGSNLCNSCGEAAEAAWLEPDEESSDNIGESKEQKI